MSNVDMSDEAAEILALRWCEIVDAQMLRAGAEALDAILESIWESFYQDIQKELPPCYKMFYKNGWITKGFIRDWWYAKKMKK